MGHPPEKEQTMAKTFGQPALGAEILNQMGEPERGK
jgi:hypothetical protein